MYTKGPPNIDVKELINDLCNKKTMKKLMLFGEWANTLHFSEATFDSLLWSDPVVASETIYGTGDLNQLMRYKAKP